MKNIYKLFLVSGLIIGRTTFSSINFVTAEETNSVEATGSITPDSYTEEMWAGETISLERTVTISVEDIVETITSSTAPDKLDVLFLADNTDSMGDAISNVQDNARSLIQTLNENYGDVQIGVARYYGDPKEVTTTSTPTGEVFTFTRNYTYQTQTTCETSQGETYDCYEYSVVQIGTDGSHRDYITRVPLSTRESYGDTHTTTFDSQYSEVTQGELGAESAYELQEMVNSGSVDDAVAAIDNWSASSGRDWSEGSFFALHQAATSGTATNSSYSTGDATGWRSDAKKIIVWFGDAKSHTTTIEQPEVIEALNAQDISVVAIHTNSTPKSFTDGLDADFQASTIASATKGQYASVYSADLSSTITSLIGNTVETTNVISPGIDLVFDSIDNPEGLDINYTCTDTAGCNNVQDGESRTFTMDITANEPGTYVFKTIVSGVVGAEADNNINVRLPYPD